MGNDIEIRVRVANNTATGLAAVNRSLNQLRSEARDAGRGLDTLTAKAAAATLALRGLKDAAQDASRALRSMNVAARNADGRLTTLSDRSRQLRSDTDDLDGSMRRLTGTMGGLRGSLGTLRTSSSSAGDGMNGLRKAALMLSPALIPIAAAAAPIAGNLLAAGAAVGAFGLAVGGQIAALAKAAEAEKKYNDAVRQHGKASEEATKAEAEYLRQVRQMDPATRRAAAAFGIFKDEYKAWSQSLAGDTMPVVTKGLATFGGLLPRLSPLVRATSSELDRLMTVLAGGVNSSGFERLMDTFGQFAGGVPSRATDGLVRFMRTMSEGGGSSEFSEFMAYVRDVGPQVADTLGNLGRALAHLVAAASESGVGILSVVNALAKLVNAVPTDVLSALLQFVLVFKAVKLAALGLGGAAGAVSAFGTAIAAMAAASAGAGGGLAGLAVAFGTLSRAAKVALIGSGIGILVVALGELSQMGKKAPPDVDKLATSLRGLSQTGKVTGEAARSFGKDLSGLADSLQKVIDPEGLDQAQQSIVSFFGTDSTPVKDAKENIDALDKSLAGLVKAGHADLAADALKNITKSMKAEGFSAKEVSDQLDDYKASLKDQAFEQQLAAQSMGLFGDQALAVQGKLDAQKQSADGLRQSIEALNDANRNALGGMIGFEASIDAAAKAAKENAGSLDMVGGKLDVNSPKAQAAATALNDLATKTKDAALAARESGDSWETVSGIYDRGRGQLVKFAQQMGLSKSEAQQLAEQILNIPDSKKTILKMEKEDAQAGLEAFNAAVKRTPGSKSVTLKTLSKGAETILESFGLKVRRLPNGKVTVTAATGGALSGIGNVSGALNALDGKTANTYTNHYTRNYVSTLRDDSFGVPLIKRDGGIVKGYADGGNLQHFPNGGYIEGPGGPRSDDILATFASGATAAVSDSEYVVQSSAVKKYGVQFMDALNAGRLKVAALARGGMTQKMKDARAELRDQFDISHFGRKAGYSRTPFEKALGASSDLKSLVSALNGARGDIKRATSGRTETRLLKQLDGAGKALIKYEKQLLTVSKSLEKAKDKLDSLKSAASQLRDSVKSGVLSSANITRSVSDDKPTTVRSVMGGLTASRDKATAFAGALKDLAKRGLSKDLLKQIAEAGIEGGGLETAGALLRASSSELKSMNELQSQIAKAAGSAGKTTADAFYGAAIKAQDKLVKSLQKQQDKLEKAMDRLAKSLEKAISRAIGKKASGGIIGAASGGARGGLTWVGEQEPELVQLPYGSRVRSGPDSRRIAAAAGGGSSAPILINLSIGGREFGELWIDTGRREIRNRGGIQAAFATTR